VGQLSLALALGGLLIAILFSGLAFVMTRELPFLFFGLAMLGEIMLEAYRTGLLQRFFWPADWALPPQMAAVASMMAVLSFTGFFFTFVPKLPQHRLHYRAFVLAIVVTVSAQLWSVAVNYGVAVQVWSMLVNVVLVIGIWIVWLAWRSGFKPAGTLLLGFSCVLALELGRIVTLLGFRSFSQAEILLGPWALVLTTPVILMSVFHRSRDIHARLFQAESDNQAKIQFLSQMSHELRTPLDIILGNAQLLTRQATGSPLRREFLDHIQQSGWHLLSMIDEILDYSRGVAGHLPIENARLDWPYFLRNLSHNAQVLADKNGNQFAMTNTTDNLSHVVTDGKRLRQVLDNLLTNASKHTRGGSIHLDCAVAEYNGQWKLSFAVTDSGEGIALEDQKRIFLPFERGVNRTQAQDKGIGIGMGLAISRQLVEAMGGQLSVQSVPGQGACFRFWIMADKATELAAQAGDTMGGGLKLTRVSGYTGACKSVLVIDDEAAIRQTLVNLLTEVGLQAHAADSGAAAVKLLTTTPSIDLILTDQFMENGDGWSVLAQVAVRWPILPVMLMSAAPPKRPENFPTGLDFAAHLLKPLDYQKLLLQIGELLHIEWVLQPDSQLDSSTAGASPHEVLTAQDRASLRTLINSGQMSAIMAWAQDLKRRSPENAAMADALEAAARGLDMAALDRLSA
jgi:signal transduction histidine kinase/response regulator of citrate/malate metabolism